VGFYLVEPRRAAVYNWQPRRTDMTVEALVESLSQSEKLLAMELIWRDLSNNAADLPSPDWHDAVVHQRLDNPMPGEVLNLQDAFREIQGWRNANKPSP
jgi:hypothetical protein